MVPLHTDNKGVSICDNFFLGGPVTFRGFDFRGAGPNIDGSFLGAKVRLKCSTCKAIFSYFDLQFVHSEYFLSFMKVPTTI